MSDPELMSPISMRDVVSEHGRGAAVVILGDGGAARGRYDVLRLLDTVAFLKGAKQWSDRLVWLNPLPPRRGRAVRLPRSPGMSLCSRWTVTGCTGR